MTGHIVYVKTKSKIIEAGENLFRTNLMIWELATCGTTKVIKTVVFVCQSYTERTY